jgi:hypothetical protein
MRRQSWSPSGADPHEYLEGHFAHQPATVERRLRQAGLMPTSWLAVSMFRSARLKGLVPARFLAMLESPLQAPLGRLAPSPSVYIASRSQGRATIGGAQPREEPQGRTGGASLGS